MSLYPGIFRIHVQKLDVVLNRYEHFNHWFGASGKTILDGLREEGIKMLHINRERDYFNVVVYDFISLARILYTYDDVISLLLCVCHTYKKVYICHTDLFLQ